MEPEYIFIREPAHAGELTLAAQSGQQFHEGFFALTFDGEIHVFRIQSGVRIKRREISTPNDGNFWVFPPEFATQFHCRHHLRAWHDGNRQQFDMIRGGERVQSGRWLGIQIAIDNHVLLGAFEDRGDRENGKWKSPVLRLAGAGMEQDDHREPNFPARMKNCDGGRVPLMRARHGRSAHFHPCHGRLRVHSIPSFAARSASVSSSRYSIL